MKKQRNCHARSKQKRKVLRLRNRAIKVFITHNAKKIGTSQESTIPRSAIILMEIARGRKNFDLHNAMKRNPVNPTNQRKRRKLVRQMNGYKKAC